MHQKRRAFTLLELLVVLVIIGVVIAAASLMLSNSRQNQENLRSSVDLFRGRTVLAQQEALLSTSTLGVGVSSTGYQFYRYVETLPSHRWSWRVLKKDKVLTYHKWPSDSQIYLALPGKTAILLGDITPTAPQIIFYPSGQITAFTISANNEYQITGNANGSINAGDARG